MNGAAYQVLADAVLTLHVAVVVFVVAGLVLIVAGNCLAWRWVNVLWFRIAHLAAIGIVAAQAWLGVICPLTSLEMWLRAKARETASAGSTIEHVLQRILYHEAPGWVFAVCYSLFGLAVAATWVLCPPRRGRRGGRQPA